MNTSESSENYLETILILSKSRPVVRSVDIAEELGFKKSSVSVAMKNLREREHITVTKEGFIYLTQTGREIAEMIYERHELFTKWQREYILKKCMANIVSSGAYDYILIDAPPTLGGWVMNILCASDAVIIPVESSPWGMFGLANMFEFLGEVRQIAPNLETGGVVITKVDTRKSYFRQTPLVPVM